MNSIIVALTLAYFGLTGSVAEVTQYGLYAYEKTIHRFDILGRLIEYEEYGHPFTGDGGCVVRKMAHYKYAYGDNDSLIVLYSYNEYYNSDETLDDTVLLLYPPRIAADTLYKYAERDTENNTACHHLWLESDGKYHAALYDSHGNWTERVMAGEDDYTRADIMVRQISYYRDVELMGLNVGVHTVTHRWTDDGRDWQNQYTFDRQGSLEHFQSFVDSTPLYEWQRGNPDDADVAPESLITIDTTSQRSIDYWGEL